MKVLVVVDMQNDFIDGALGTPEAQAIVPNVVKKIKEYKENGGVVVYTMDTHYSNYLETIEGQKLPVPHCIRLTDGWLIHKDIIADIDGENSCRNVIEKSTFGSYNLPYTINAATYERCAELGLDRSSVDRDPSLIEVVGLCTDICVISNVTMLKAHYPNTPIIVDSSCCAGTTPESHQRALEAMKMCHIDVV